jgi:hypothetical protein
LVAYKLLVKGKPFTRTMTVKVIRSGTEVARGKSSGKHIAFAWAPPDDGGVYDLEFVAGPHRVAIKDVSAREFHADWTIELDFPPFQHTCGAEVPAGDRANVIRVDCVTFDDRKGDPPQRVMLHKKVPSK